MINFLLASLSGHVDKSIFNLIRQAVIVQSGHDGANDVQIRSSLKPPSFTFYDQSNLHRYGMGGFFPDQCMSIWLLCSSSWRQSNQLDSETWCIHRMILDSRSSIDSNLATKVIVILPWFFTFTYEVFTSVDTTIWICVYVYMDSCPDVSLFVSMMSMTLSRGHSRFSVQLGVAFLGRCQIRAGQSCMLVKEEHFFSVVLGCFGDLYGFVLCDFMHVSPCE